MMTNRIGENLVVLCNGCGEPMRNLGEWPVTFPRDTMITTQGFRYACHTCRIPSDKFEPGYTAGFVVIGVEKR